MGDLRTERATVERLLARNATLGAVLECARTLALPGWYLTAGAVFQTVWNGLAGRDAAAGIRDYDLCYFDAADLSWEAEARGRQSALSVSRRPASRPMPSALAAAAPPA